MGEPALADATGSATRARIRWPYGLAAAVVAAVGVLLLATMLLGSQRIVVSENTFVNDAGPEGLIEANNSPGLVRNPTDPDQVVVVARVDQPRFSAELDHSNDGGRTWQTNVLPLPEGLDRPYAPDAAFGPDGTLYVTYVNLAGRGNSPDGLWVSRSDDGGATLSPPVQIGGALTFQAQVVVDADGTVHVTYLQAEQVGTLSFTGPVAVMAMRSTDGGDTFSDPVRVSDPDRDRVGAATPVVTGDGQLTVLYEDFTDDVRDFGNLEGPVWDGPAALVMARSPDGGESFAPGVVIDDGLVPAKRFLPYLPDMPSVAAGPGDRMYVAWADARNGPEDVFVRRSDDGGATWQAPVQVSDDATGTAQYLPAVAVAPDGRVDLAYYDRATDTDQTMVKVATSTDRARTFQTVDVASAPFAGRVGVPLERGFIDPNLGSRLAVNSSAAGALAVWTDTRAGQDLTLGRQDLVGARITIPAARRGMPAAAIGALVVAAAILVVGRIRAGRMLGSGR